MPVNARIRQHQALARRGTRVHELNTLLFLLVHGGSECGRQGLTFIVQQQRIRPHDGRKTALDHPGDEDDAELKPASDTRRPDEYTTLGQRPFAIDLSGNQVAQARQELLTCGRGGEPVHRPQDALQALCRELSPLDPLAEQGERGGEEVAPAFERDDALPQAYGAQAAIRCWHEWDWEGAEEAFIRAIDLDPSDSDTRGVYSQYLTMMRRFDEAVVQMDRAMQLSPLDPFLPSMHAADLLFMKRYEESVELARRVLDEVPNHEVASTVLADGLYLLGQFDEELDAQRLRAVALGDREIEEALEKGYQAEGYRGAMRFVADLLATRSERQYVSPMTIMLHYLRAGDVEKALDWAEEALDQHLDS